MRPACTICEEPLVLRVALPSYATSRRCRNCIERIALGDQPVVEVMSDFDRAMAALTAGMVAS